MDFQSRYPQKHPRMQQSPVKLAYPNWERQEPVYSPEKNRNNVYVKGTKSIEQLPEPKKMYSANPLSQIL